MFSLAHECGKTKFHVEKTFSNRLCSRAFFRAICLFSENPSVSRILTQVGSQRDQRAADFTEPRVTFRYHCPFLFLALKRFHGLLHYQTEMKDIEREQFALNGEKPKKPWQLFTDRSIKWQLITVIVMTMGQQLSGINAVSVKSPLLGVQRFFSRNSSVTVILKSA